MKNSFNALINKVVNAAALKWNNYYTVERLYTESRRKLYNTPSWRFGNERIHEVSAENYSYLSKFSSIVGKSYMEMGAGKHHPLGNSAVMFINGASKTFAFDIQRTEESRAAEALFDLLSECAVNPSYWHMSEISRDEYLNNIYKFNIAALKKGDLQKGLNNLPLKHIVGDIHKNILENNSVDLMSSRAVLEHFLDFPKAAEQLYRVMAPGGLAFHRIDFVDHRAYTHPKKYHFWSFLAEDDDWTDNLCNRLRFSEIKQYLEKAGFELPVFEPMIQQMPQGFRKQLKGRFKNMSDEELNKIGVLCVIKKPA